MHVTSRPCPVSVAWDRLYREVGERFGDDEIVMDLLQTVLAARKDLAYGNLRSIADMRGDGGE